MDSVITESEPNPLLCNAPNTICIVCNRKLENRTVSTQKILPHYEPPISFFEGLKLLTNFGDGDINIDNVPQQACHTCFLNTDGFLRFQKACHTAVGNIRGYILCQERLQHHIAEAECQVLQSSASDASDDDFNSMMDFSEEKNDAQNEKDDWYKEKIRKDKLKRNIIKKTQKAECTVCHKVLRKSSLGVHMKTHSTNTMSYQCKLCDKKYKSEGCLYTHVRYKHECHKFEPLLCSVCGKKFTIQSVLNKHISLHHSDERPHACETCGKTFKIITHLRSHYATHSDEKNFPCSKCGKKFGTLKLLKQHSVTHAEVRPIECKLCGKRFTQQHCLRSHQAKTCEALHAQANNSNPI